MKTIHLRRGSETATWWRAGWGSPMEQQGQGKAQEERADAAAVRAELHRLLDQVLDELVVGEGGSFVQLYLAQRVERWELEALAEQGSRSTIATSTLKERA